MPDPVSQKIASAMAAETGAQMVRAGVTPGAELVVGVASIQQPGPDAKPIKVVVFAVEDDGPLRMHPSTLAAIEAIGRQGAPPDPAPPQITSPGTSPRPVELTPLQQRIVNVLSSERPRKAAWIAAKLDMEPGGSFRGTLANLVRFGVIRRAPAGGGYLLV